jgi:hypothetical protein
LVERGRPWETLIKRGERFKFAPAFATTGAAVRLYGEHRRHKIEGRSSLSRVSLEIGAAGAMSWLCLRAAPVFMERV